MTNPRRVTVIGAGVAGLSTALLLQASGFSVRIVSASSPAKSEEDELYTVGGGLGPTRPSLSDTSRFASIANQSYFK